MRTMNILPILGISVLAACATTLSGRPSPPPLLYNTQVEYVEVESLVSASENALIPLGPGRSYWYDTPDGARWASDSATVPASTKVLIWHQGIGHVDPSHSDFTLRHVEGPREVKEGWYGRITEIQAGANESMQVTIEDGRRFEVTGEARDDLARLPFEVLIGEDQETIFVLGDGGELNVVRAIPLGG